MERCGARAKTRTYRERAG
ncbi:MAG: hypothetical protein M3P39_12085 [Actinomycetota bacterium]|nr:hypothetical protein [Actinomycetota bacterium]